MNKIKSMFKSYSSEVSLSEAKKKELWKKISGEQNKSFSEKFMDSLKRAAPALFSVGMVYVGVSYYRNNVLVRDSAPLVESQDVIVDEDIVANESSNSDSGLYDYGPISENDSILSEDVYNNPDDITLENKESNSIILIDPTAEVIGTPDGSSYTELYEDYSEDNTTPSDERAKDIDAIFYYLVEDVKSATDTTYSNIVEFDGIVISSSMDVDRSTFVARIPTEKFEEFRSSINGIAKVVKTESVNIKDKQDEITSHSEEITDYQEQIKELKTKLAKETNAKKKDLFRSEIEMLEKQIEYTENVVAQIEEDVSMANITITYAIDTETFAGSMKHTLEGTFVELGDATVTLVNGTIIGIFFAIPIVLVYSAVRFILKIVTGKK